MVFVAWGLLGQLCQSVLGTPKTHPGTPEYGTLPHFFSSSDLVDLGSLGWVNFKIEEETAKIIQIQIVRESQSTSRAWLCYVSASLYDLHNSKTWEVQKNPHVLLSLKADFFFPTKHLPSA